MPGTAFEPEVTERDQVSGLAHSKSYAPVGIAATPGPVLTPCMDDVDETRSMDELVRRLSDRFPDASSEDLHSRVRKIHEEYAGSRVRDFVPVLVEREVADQLRVPRQSRGH